MKRAIVALIIWLAGSAHAETFDDRVRIAKEAENSEAHKAYQAVMFGRIGDGLASLMSACFANTQQPVADPFVFVADITPGGKLQDIVVRPTTNIAQCFAIGIKGMEFPTPPAYASRGGFPIVFEMRIRP